MGKYKYSLQQWALLSRVRWGSLGKAKLYTMYFRVIFQHLYILYVLGVIWFVGEAWTYMFIFLIYTPEI